MWLHCGSMVSGDLLREARLRAGLSQAELARRAGTPRSTIGRWERGECMPSFERLRELVRACGLEVTYGLASADLEEHDLTLVRVSLEEDPSPAIRGERSSGRADLRTLGER